jgi:hypothetical protein
LIKLQLSIALKADEKLNAIAIESIFKHELGLSRHNWKPLMERGMVQHPTFDEHFEYSENNYFYDAIKR